MKLRRKILVAVSSLTVMTAVLLSGCSAPAAEESAISEKGILTLSVNPEIQIEYDKDGKVLALTGQNEDGIKIVEAYQDYIGKDCEEVLRELVVKINESGYFVDDIDGHKKNIVLKLEPGSVLPDDDFLINMSTSAQDAVKGLSLSSGIVTIDDDDYDQAYAKDNQPSPYITLQKAQEIALLQANVSAFDAVFEDKEFDHDDGTPVFELEFTANGNKYEYDVHAVTGKVIKAEHETIRNNASGSGSTASNNTDYGPGNDGVTDYNDNSYISNNNSGASSSSGSTASSNSHNGNSNYNGNTNYDDNGNTNYSGNTNYDDNGSTNYDDNGNTNYDDGGSNYSDDDDDDDDDNDD